MKLKVRETLAKLLDTTPIGKIVMYAGSSAPRGWLLCQGQAVSRSNYAKLFSVIGTTYGNGDGSTTFNVPDMRDRVPVCVGTTFGLAAKGGTTDVPYHRHSVAKVTTGGGTQHRHSFSMYKAGGFNHPSSGTTHTLYYAAAGTQTVYTSYESAHTHDVPAHNTNYVGNSSYSSNPNMPPYLGINFLIYVGGVAHRLLKALQSLAYRKAVVV